MSQTSAAESSAHKLRVLFVDDDLLVLSTLSEELCLHGYEVKAAACGQEALRLAAEYRPDIALLDMRMPDMSGEEVARELYARFGVPSLFLSAYGDPETVALATAAGAFGYLVKPLDVSQIVPAIGAALGQAEESERQRRYGARLAQALVTSRETGAALGVIMERKRLNLEQSYDLLRRLARSRRRKVTEIAHELLYAAETLNALDDGSGERANGTRRSPSELDPLDLGNPG